MSAAPDPSRAAGWRETWEDDVTPDEHVALSALFARAYPRTPTEFTGARSWSSARPELRITAALDGRPVAHLGILRRFLQIGGTAQLVGDVGLVAVDPDLHGRGLGAALLARAAAVLERLEMPYGFLTCGDHVVPFYAGSGWHRADAATRMVRADGRVQVYGGASMVLSVRAALADWPSGLIDRNGLEV